MRVRVSLYPKQEEMERLGFGWQEEMLMDVMRDSLERVGFSPDEPYVEIETGDHFFSLTGEEEKEFSKIVAKLLMPLAHCLLMGLALDFVFWSKGVRDLPGCAVIQTGTASMIEHLSTLGYISQEG